MTGLTPFIVAMIRADPAALSRASPAKLAAKYEIPTSYVEFYMREWRRHA